MADLEQAWARAAQVFAGELEVGPAAGAACPRLIAEIGDDKIEAGVTTSGDDFITWISGAASGAFGLRLVVTASDTYPYADTFRFNSGCADFDSYLTTRTNDAPFARLWLDDQVRGAVAATSDYHFIVADERVRAWRQGREDDANNLIAAISAVTALGERGDRIRNRWRHLAAHIGGRIDDDRCRWRPDGALSIAVALADVTVHVAGFFGALGRRRPGKGLFTRVRCARTTREADQFLLSDPAGRKALNPRLPVELERCEVGDSVVGILYTIDGEDPERTVARLDPDVRKLLLNARPEVILAEEDQITLFFLGFETDPVRVRAGVEIVAAMAIDAAAGGLAGPYR